MLLLQWFNLLLWKSSRHWFWSILHANPGFAMLMMLLSFTGYVFVDLIAFWNIVFRCICWCFHVYMLQVRSYFIHLFVFCDSYFLYILYFLWFIFVTFVSLNYTTTYTFTLFIFVFYYIANSILSNLICLTEYYNHCEFLSLIHKIDFCSFFRRTNKFQFVYFDALNITARYKS